ncbi:hypothetical protein L3X38_016374 [Prunus dulcis]|uniref:Uncharacterized protein n=1 Tax=Prunus dulcis TaxID=3755 RepID=A0AAD4Z8R0_PRUDU|nr:hypothetical protein L3X38_016374 [Prunus dulcis]
MATPNSQPPPPPPQYIPLLSDQNYVVSPASLPHSHLPRRRRTICLGITLLLVLAAASCCCVPLLAVRSLPQDSTAAA